MSIKTSRYTSSRQKSCLPCSTAKAKCDRKTGSCTRCISRGLSCTYIHPIQSGDCGSHNIATIYNALPASESSIEDLDFFNLELFSPINVDDINNRWLNAYIPLPGQKIKEYPASVKAFLYRILKSYTAAAVRGRGIPAFLHGSQIKATSTSVPLSTCLTLIRVCEDSLAGGEAAAVDMLQKEMNSLYQGHADYDNMALLGAFQAYLLYSMVLFFKLGQGSSPFLRNAVMNLQTIACCSCKYGLMCFAEQQHTCPRWEAWIVAEAKRRTLFTMYLFDSVLSTQDGLPTFMGTELQGLLAPSSKSLWRAETRREWEAEYNIHIADWMEGYLRIDELWQIPPNMEELEVIKRRQRVDRWLENVDEYGTALYAVTSGTHGG